LKEIAMSDPLMDMYEGKPTEGGDEGPQTGGADPGMEAEALEQGWVPQDQWHGRPEDWTDADTFVKRGREINPILRKSLDREKAERRRLEAELTSLRGTVAEMAEFRNKMETAIYDRALADYKAQLKAARIEGDDNTVDQVQDAIDALKENKPKPKVMPTSEPTTPTVHPAVAPWMQQNPWYTEANSDMVNYANGVVLEEVTKARKMNTPMDVEETLHLVSAKVRRMFPDKFRQASSAGMFESGRGAGSGTAAKGGSFASLPQDVKAQFERFYSAGYYPKMKKEDAAAQYYKDYTA
jgi:hypothetical protein